MSPDHNDERRQQLVAWLDGELDPSDARDMERLIANEPEIRIEMNQLLRTWDMLDQLESVRASESFTQQTLFSIQPAQSVSIDAATTAGRNRTSALSMVGWMLASLLVAVFGFRSTYDRQQAEFDDLLEHAPVIERMGWYQHIQDVDYLRQLQELRPLMQLPQADDATAR